MGTNCKLIFDSNYESIKREWERETCERWRDEKLLYWKLEREEKNKFLIFVITIWIILI